MPGWPYQVFHVTNSAQGKVQNAARQTGLGYPERIASLSPALDRRGKGAAVLRWENFGEWPSTLKELRHQLVPGLNPGMPWSPQPPTPLLQFISNTFAVQQLAKHQSQRGGHQASSAAWSSTPRGS